MLEDLLFSLECVTPYFLLIVAGYILSRTGLATQDFLKQVNRFTFRVALPMNLFLNTASTQWGQFTGGAFILYIAGATLAAFAIIWLVADLVFRRRREVVGTLVQGGFRSNYVLLGAPIAGAVVGTPEAVAKAALVAAILIPLYNLLSVLVLLMRGKGAQKPSFRSIVSSVVKNPLILGVVAGMLYAMLLPPAGAGPRMPGMLHATLQYISGTATPLGLLSIGGIFNWEDATARIKDSLFAVLFKNLLLACLTVPAAYLLGFRGEELVITLVAFASPAAVSSYAMASELGGDPPLASNILILTTFLSSFVMAAGIYLMRVLGWL